MESISKKIELLSAQNKECLSICNCDKDNCFVTYETKAELFIQNKEYIKALNCYKNVLDSSKKASPNIYWNLAKIYNLIESYESAIEYCKKAIKHNPYNKKYKETLIKILKDSGRLK